MESQWWRLGRTGTARRQRVRLETGARSAPPPLATAPAGPPPPELLHRSLPPALPAALAPAPTSFDVDRWVIEGADEPEVLEWSGSTRSGTPRSILRSFINDAVSQLEHWEEWRREGCHPSVARARSERRRWCDHVWSDRHKHVWSDKLQTPVGEPDPDRWAVDVRLRNLGLSSIWGTIREQQTHDTMGWMRRYSI